MRLRPVLVSILATVSCNKSGSGSSQASNPPPPTEETATDPASTTEVGDIQVDDNAQSNSFDEAQLDDKPGITPATGDEVVVAGTLALSLGLESATTLDTVIAIPIKDGQFGVEESIRVPVDENGKFKLTLPKAASELEMLKQALKPDGSLDPDGRKAVLTRWPQLKGLSDAELKTKLQDEIAKLESRPFAGETAYVMIGLKADDDRVAEANSFRFIGLGTERGPLINFPVKAVKGNVNLGKIAADGDDAVSELNADTEVFDISEAAIAQMASTSNALKTVKNVYMNSDPETGASFIPTPTFTWNAKLEDVATGYNDVSANVYKGFSSYIGIYKSGYKLADVCAADAGARTIFSLYPPAEVTSGDPPQTYGPNAPRTTGGTLGQALQSEGGGDRQNCQAGGVYIAGNQEGTGELEQLGIIPDLKEDSPAGLWKLKQGDKTVANFDLAITNPRDDAGRPTIFVPALTYDVDAATKKITAYHVKFYLWNQVTEAYEAVTDTEAFDRVRYEIGIDAIAYNGNSENVRPSSRAFVEPQDGVFTITELRDQGDNLIEMYAPGATGDVPIVGNFFLYYRAFGNSYNFFWPAADHVD